MNTSENVNQENEDKVCRNCYSREWISSFCMKKKKLVKKTDTCEQWTPDIFYKEGNTNGR